MQGLQKEVDELKQGRNPGSPVDKKPSYGELKLELIQTRQELNRAKEILQGIISQLIVKTSTMPSCSRLILAQKICGHSIPRA